MSCWKVLGIEPTADKAVIKRAYAVMLKLNKPDENPQGFSQLHAAYKQALQQSPRYAEAVVEEEHETVSISAQDGNILDSAIDQTQSRPHLDVPVEYSIEQQHELTAAPQLHSPHALEPVMQADDEELYFDDLDEAWENLVDSTHHALSSPARANDKDCWTFIEETDALYDLQFKAEFSYFLFEKLLEYYEQQHLDKPFNRHIIDYLDNTFRWRDKRDVMEGYYGYERVEFLLGPPQALVEEQQFKWTSPKIHRGPMVYGGYYARIFSTLLDIIAVMFIASFIVKISNKYGLHNFLADSGKGLAGLYLYALIVPIMEASPLQASLGKLLFGMKVVSPRGRRINIFHALWRNLVYIACTAGFKVTIWINFFINDGRLLHDRLSKSIVIKR